jgi:lipoprotein-anchoring transpeptidase ErfK/SrfK
MRGWFPRVSRDVRRISRGCLARASDGAVVARRFLAGHVWQSVAAGVTLVAVIAAALAATSGGAGASPGDAAPRAHQHRLVAPVRVSAAALAKLPRATTYTSIPSAPGDPAPFAVTSGLVVRPLKPQILYAGPGKPPVAVLPTTELGGPTWVPVVQTSPEWERVLLPSRPNRATGWIYTGATGSQLDTRRSAYLVRIKVGARKLSAYYDGRPLGTWTVAVGAPATPTPTGRTFLLALLAPPHPTYSPLILPLGFHSNTLTTFGGGPGTVGLHGWPDSSVFGRAISHGCVRVPAAALHVLSQIPLGSLILITA